MKFIYAVLFVVALGAAFLAGSWASWRVGAVAGPSVRTPLYYVDPMHPSYTSDKPGTAPDCGMALQPVYDGSPAPDRRGTVPAGAIAVSARQQQLIGVRVEPVRAVAGSRRLKLVGRVAADETRVFPIGAGTDGYIRSISAATTGSPVKKGQVLATFSAPNAASTLQMFILNSGASDRVRQSRTEGSPEAQQIGAATANIQQRVQQLQNLGIAAEQIDEIARTRQMPDELQIIAPAEGVIIARNVAAGQKFERGAEWYRVADLSAVWILADAFGSDVEYIRPGAEARVTLTERHRSFAARVSQVPPQFDAATRTLKVRLEAANPGFALRPDMFVDVELPVAGPTVLAVPADAVIDSGLHQVVFVERGDGVFEPRQVETGWRAADRVEIRRGLSAGERIAVAGAFFLDAESRLHPSSQPVPGAR